MFNVCDNIWFETSNDSSCAKYKPNIAWQKPKKNSNFRGLERMMLHNNSWLFVVKGRFYRVNRPTMTIIVSLNTLTSQWDTLCKLWSQVRWSPGSLPSSPSATRRFLQRQNVGRLQPNWTALPQCSAPLHIVPFFQVRTGNLPINQPQSMLKKSGPRGTSRLLVANIIRWPWQENTCQGQVHYQGHLFLQIVCQTIIS